MRKIISILLAFTFIICMSSGCKSKKEDTSSSKNPQASEKDASEDPNSGTPESEPPYYSEILAKDGNLLGRIDGRASASAADEGVFYSIFVPAEYQATATAQYHLFRESDGKDILLGTLEEQGYETIYSRVEMDGIVYTLALTGNPNDEEPDSLWLLSFDLKNEKMEKVLVSENASPYAAMTAANGKVLILVHEFGSPKCDKVLEFDSSSGTLQEILSFPSDGENTESLRGVYTDAEHLYLLRLTVKSGNPDELYLDTYDTAYTKTSERSLRELIFSEEYHGVASPYDEKAEIGMIVSGFAVWEDRYLYYENFAVTRALLDLQTGKNLFAADDNYSLSRGSGMPFFYYFDLGQAEPDQDVQGIYELKNGAVEKKTLTPPDTRTMIRSISVSPNETWLVTYSDSAPRDAGTDALVIWRES
ncbi:MAG: hypothetical protein J5636_00370 [Clostridiales bacterium]|nr:hypothetical protein [Clostridiales bacterium]